MAEKDFDTDGLAKYLHLSPQQVERLATRGKVPGRKIGGKWKFSMADIHHWMEERMGLLEDDELAQVEGVLARADNMQTAEISLSEMLDIDRIKSPLTAKSKNSVIAQMCELAACTGLLWDPEKMAEAIHSREQLQSTAMDNGVALLHPRRPLANILAEPLVAVGVSPQGIPFGGSRGMTDVFFLVASTDDRGHLRTLARLSRLISADDLLHSIRQAADSREICRLLCEAEADLPA